MKVAAVAALDSHSTKEEAQRAGAIIDQVDKAREAKAAEEQALLRLAENLQRKKEEEEQALAEAHRRRRAGESEPRKKLKNNVQAVVRSPHRIRVNDSGSHPLGWSFD